MDKAFKLTRLALLRDQIEPLTGDRERSSSPRFVTWHRDVQVLLDRAFGKDSSHRMSFDAVRFSLFAFSDRTDEREFQRAFDDGLRSARAVIDSIISEVQTYERDEVAMPNASGHAVDRVAVVERICRRFPGAARQLRVRHASRGGIDISDEYDVQDVMHSFLRLEFDDIRPEEWTPSYAGSSSRMDFLLKRERIVVEVKKTRTGLRAKEARDQLAVDIDRYRAHPDCETLVCFVFDPDHLIPNATGFESDLEGQRTSSLNVLVVVSPQ